MCKQDIRIARAATPRQPVDPVIIGNNTQVLPPNPNRYAIFLAIHPGDPADGDTSTFYFVKFGAHEFPLVVLNTDRQSCILNLVECGQVIQSAVFVRELGQTAATDKFAGEAAFDVDVESIP